VNLVESYLASKGKGQEGNLLAANDFKQILQAFGIKLTPQVSVANSNGQSAVMCTIQIFVAGARQPDHESHQQISS